MFKSFQRWSWSQLDTYRSCPFRARLKYIEHSPEPPLPPDAPNLCGSRVHKAGEDYVAHNGELTDEIKPFEEPLNVVRSMYHEDPSQVEVEGSIYLDQNWRQLPDRDGYWLVYKPDLLVRTPERSLTIDLKTGKKYGNEVKHFGQIQLYVIGEWCRHPEYSEYEAELWYIDQKDVVPHVFTPTDLATARARLDKEVQSMLADKVHVPRPNIRTCKYCPYSPRGTGACPVGV